jgi:hypothetical protein
MGQSAQVLRPLFWQHFLMLHHCGALLRSGGEAVAADVRQP